MTEETYLLEIADKSVTINLLTEWNLWSKYIEYLRMIIRVESLLFNPEEWLFFFS